LCQQAGSFKTKKIGPNLPNLRWLGQKYFSQLNNNWTAFSYCFGLFSYICQMRTFLLQNLLMKYFFTNYFVLVIKHCLFSIAFYNDFRDSRKSKFYLMLCNPKNIRTVDFSQFSCLTDKYFPNKIELMWEKENLISNMADVLLWSCNLIFLRFRSVRKHKILSILSEI